MIPTPVNRQFVHPPRHGLKPEGVTPATPGEKIKPVCPLFSKWQIGLGQRLKPYRGGAAPPQGERSVPLRGSTQRGVPSGRFFGDFLIGEKVTRGAGRSARIGGGRDHRPCINLPRGAEHGKAMLSRSARIRRRRGCQPRINPPGPQGPRPSHGERRGAPAPRVELGAGSARQLTGRLLCFTIGIKFYWNMVESR